MHWVVHHIDRAPCSKPRILCQRNLEPPANSGVADDEKVAFQSGAGARVNITIPAHDDSLGSHSTAGEIAILLQLQDGEAKDNQTGNASKGTHEAKTAGTIGREHNLVYDNFTEPTAVHSEAATCHPIATGARVRTTMKLKLAILLLPALVIAGCGKTESTVMTGPDGEKVTRSMDGTKTTYTDGKGNTAEVTQDGNNVSVKDDKGNTFNAGGTVSEADMGLAFYPGSSEKPNGSMVAESNGEKFITCVRTSKDDPEKVAEFYKGMLEGVSVTTNNSNDMKMAMLSGGKLKDGAEVTITAIKQKDQDTDISIGVKRKSK